jgi:major vault protein
MSESSGMERDLVLAPNEYAYVSDKTKGKIDIYVGPHKTSLAQTDQPVVFSNRTKKFKKVHSLDEAIQLFSTAPEGWYLILKNPATDEKQPPSGVGSLPPLDVGRKVNVPGPVSYPLWPGQMVRVVQGHHLRSNQYILARVYDEEAAKKNWSKAVIKSADEAVESAEMPDFTMGKLLVIKGTEVSFYIPPTGVEVVADDDGKLLRDAETLERLEYCILLDEDGNKRYVRGPDVVFPEPTENFMTKKGSRKFKAIELNENSGLYIKVIAEYEEDKKSYKVGDELFITGNEQMIYFPREEHAIIKYGNQDIHFGIAIPAGEARYVLNRLSGEITIKEGPCVFLPDPRKEVIVRRVLDPKLVELWFPGNKEALSYNEDLQDMIARYQPETDGFMSNSSYYTNASTMSMSMGEPISAKTRKKASKDLMGDDFERKQNYTPPRTITLDTKYEGTIDIDIWTGYAVLVVSKSGNRRVVVGPTTVHLAYDESLEGFSLSTGTPKSDKDLIRDVYLRVLHNKVSDKVKAMTKDLCEVSINLSYRVNFEGEKEKWFNVENYVKFLTDHLRSIIRSAVKMHGIEEFYANSIEIIRDFVLGKHSDNGRAGRAFKENGMHVYDVEVLSVDIGDSEIEDLLTTNQYEIVEMALDLAKRERSKQFDLLYETNKREINQAVSETKKEEINLKRSETVIKTEAKESEEALARRDEEIADLIHDAELARKEKDTRQRQSREREELNLKMEEMKAETEAVKVKTEAITPDLIAAMQAIGDKALLEKVADSFNVLSILGGKSLTDVVQNMM